MLALQHEFSVLGLTHQLLVRAYVHAGRVWSSTFGEQVLFGIVGMELGKIFPISYPSFCFRPFFGQETELLIFLFVFFFSMTHGGPRQANSHVVWHSQGFFAYKQVNFPFRRHSFSKFQFKPPSELVQSSALCLLALCSFVSYSFEIFEYGLRLSAHPLVRCFRVLVLLVVCFHGRLLLWLSNFSSSCNCGHLLHWLFRFLSSRTCDRLLHWSFGFLGLRTCGRRFDGRSNFQAQALVVICFFW